MDQHTQYGARPRGASDVRDARIVGMRASDADRDETAALLRQHYAAGRLDAPEFEARIGRCYAATALDELRQLVADLPRDTAGWPEPERARSRRRPPTLPAPLIPIVVAFVLLAGLTGGHTLWLAWPLAFLLVRGRLVRWPARSAWARRPSS